MADATNKDNKFEKLTPIVEYTYVVVYNLLNTMRSLKNYVQAYSRDMGLQELEQYQSAIKAVEEAINGLTNSAKDLGAIYGLPEDVLHPEKMLKGLGEQIQRMQERGELPDMTKLADKLAGANNQGGSQPESQAQPAPAAVPPTPPEPKSASQAPVPPTPPAQPQPESPKSETSSMQNTPASAVSTGGSANTTTTPASNAPASTDQDQSQPSQQPASQTNQQPANSSSADDNSSASGDDDEIKKILDQLKALRNNQ